MNTVVRIIQYFGDANQDIGQTLPMTFAEAERIAKIERNRNRPGVVVETSAA